MRRRKLVLASSALLSLIASLLIVTPAGAAPRGPTVDWVTNAGRTAGGQHVTIEGIRFTGVRAVYFGATRAARVKVRSSTVISAVTPAHRAGTVNVRVVTDAGRSRNLARSHFRFVAPPQITSVTPESATTAGPSRITIRGDSFVDYNSVRLDGAVLGLERGSNTHQLVVFAPFHAAGTVTLRVTTPYGTDTHPFTYRIPAVPYLNFDSTTASRVRLEWGAAEGGGTLSFKLRRAAGAIAPASPSSGTAVLSQPAGGDTTFTDTSVVPGHRYSYSVFVTDTAGHSSPPRSVSVFAGRPSTIPWAKAAAAVTVQGSPDALSCPTTAWCMSVDEAGQYRTSDGSIWSAPQALSFAPDGPGSLSCVTPTFCVLVGFGTRVATWNGSLWSDPTVLDSRSFTSDTNVSCWDVGGCTVVDTGHTYVLHDGTWSTKATPPSANAEPAALSCVSANLCRGVVYDGGISTFNGTYWLTRKPFSGDVHLLAVTCLDSDFCVAGGFREARKGESTYSAVMTTFTGSQWSVPEVVGSGLAVQSISCATATSCVSSLGSGEVATFDGTWSAPRMLDPAPTVIRSGAVSCPSTTMCGFTDSNGRSAWYDGSNWSPADSFDRARGGGWQLSCASSAFCAAVDQHGNAYTFDGSTWSAPTPVLEYDAPISISCGSAALCVIFARRRSDDRVVTTRYDGQAWSAATSFSSTSDDWIAQVSCAGGSFCLAVGGHFERNHTAFRPVDAVFDGTRWSGLRLIDGSHQPTTVACTSSTFCISTDEDGFVRRYDGTRWLARTAIAPALSVNSTTCVSSTFCLATAADGRTARYNGSTWSVLTGALIGHEVTGVSCASPTLCVAAGSGYAGVFTYDGTDWSTRTSLPNAPPDADSSISVSCVPPSRCVALAGSNTTYVSDGQ